MPLGSKAGRVDLSKNPNPAGREEAKRMIEDIEGEFRRGVYDPHDRHNVLRADPMRHVDYSHRIYMDPNNLRNHEYHSERFTGLPTKVEMEKPTQHFFRFGLQIDLEDEIQLTKHIQVYRFKNLIEIIVDGKRVKQVELLVLAHFLSIRQGRLYAAEYSELKFIYDIEKGSSSHQISGAFQVEIERHKIQHFVLRPHHHTRGHPVTSARAKSKTYKKVLGGFLS
jgi:hypothetical protein